MRRPILLVSVLLLQGILAHAQTPDSTQRDLVDVILGKKAQNISKNYREGKKVHYSIFPAAANIPGGGRAVITSVNAAFYLDDPSATNLSSVYFIPYTNLADRYGIYIRPNIWTPKNRFNLQGDYRLAHFPQYSWGLGGNSPQWNESLIDSDYLRLYQTFLFKVQEHWYIGPGYLLDYHYNISEDDYLGEGHLVRYGEEGLTGTTSSGFTFNLVHDSRVNAINPPSGLFFQALWRLNSESLGSTYSNQFFFADLRKYFLISQAHRHILAARAYYWTLVSGKSPYLDLPATNWQPTLGISGRGLQTGRYRSNGLIYTEAEQRIQLSPNGLVGLVAFVNVSSASEFDTQQYKYWQVGGGTGLRLKLNKYSGANLAIDFAFSSDYWSVWLNVGEVF